LSRLQELGRMAAFGAQRQHVTLADGLPLTLGEQSFATAI